MEEFRHHAIVEEPAGTNDQWIPASRADGLKGDYVQIANTVHPRYRKHYEYYGYMATWGNNKDTYPWRPLFFYAISKGGVNSYCVPMTTPPTGFYNIGNNTAI